MMPRECNEDMWFVQTGTFVNLFTRDRYRRYKDLYKKQLELPDNENIKNLIKDLEDKLDIANILMAREQAKLEVNGRSSFAEIEIILATVQGQTFHMTCCLRTYLLFMWALMEKLIVTTVICLPFVEFCFSLCLVMGTIMTNPSLLSSRRSPRREPRKSTRSRDSGIGCGQTAQRTKTVSRNSLRTSEAKIHCLVCARERTRVYSSQTACRLRRDRDLLSRQLAVVAQQTVAGGQGETLQRHRIRCQQKHRPHSGGENIRGLLILTARGEFAKEQTQEGVQLPLARDFFLIS